MKTSVTVVLASFFLPYSGTQHLPECFVRPSYQSDKSFVFIFDCTLWQAVSEPGPHPAATQLLQSATIREEAADSLGQDQQTLSHFRQNWTALTGLMIGLLTRSKLWLFKKKIIYLHSLILMNFH